MKRNSEIHTRVVYLKSTLRVYFRGYKLKSRPGYESITFALPPSSCGSRLSIWVCISLDVISTTFASTFD